MKNNIKKTLNLEAFKISKLTNQSIIIGGGEEEGGVTIQGESTRICNIHK